MHGFIFQVIDGLGNQQAQHPKEISIFANWLDAIGPGACDAHLQAPGSSSCAGQQERRSPTPQSPIRRAYMKSLPSNSPTHPSQNHTRCRELCSSSDIPRTTSVNNSQMAEAAVLPVLTILLLLTACLGLFVAVQIATTYTHAYLAAPTEITTFVDTVDCSIQENESYDRDVEKVQILADKLRLMKLLREIQKSGDDLREDLNKLLIDEGGTRLRTSARIFWSMRKAQLEERTRRLDMLRMRFLVVYMGLIAAKTGSQPKDPEKQNHIPKPPVRPIFNHALTEGIQKAPPLRRLATQAMGHNDNVGAVPKQGWMGVVHELQNSPLMHKRRASIETSMTSPRSPRSPLTPRT